MLVSFHNAKFIRETSPISQQSYRQVEVSRASIQCKVPLTGAVCSGEVHVGLKTGSYRGAPVGWSGRQAGLRS